MNIEYISAQNQCPHQEREFDNRRITDAFILTINEANSIGYYSSRENTVSCGIFNPVLSIVPSNLQQQGTLRCKCKRLIRLIVDSIYD